jgi:hypothetical protein
VKIPSQSRRVKSGRPPKFRGPRRPITVTLPEDTLNRLASIDPDRARAIVKVTDAAIPPNEAQRNPIEIVEIGDGLGIIIVGPSQLLAKIEGLRMVEVAPMRFLLTIPLGTSIDSLAMAIIDAVENAAACEEWERSTLMQLRDLIRHLRRRGGLSKAEMLFVDTQRIRGEAAGVKQTNRGIPLPPQLPG